MNFGTLKNIFTEKLIESYTSEETVGKDLYKNFLKILKESETLKTTFIVFKNLESQTLNSETAANDYLKENISFLNNFRGKQSLKEQSKKLLTLLESSGIEYKNLKATKLHQDIQNLITSPRNVGTLQKLQEAREGVVSWLISEKDVIKETEGDKYIKKNINPKKFLNIATDKFNEKYKDSLTEEEKNILKVLRENNEDTIKDLVSNLVKETVILVNNHLIGNEKNITIKEKLLDTKDVIYKMTENNGNFRENVLKLYELKKNLNS
jgi:hypothetical protein